MTVDDLTAAERVIWNKWDNARTDLAEALDLLRSSDVESWAWLERRDALLAKHPACQNGTIRRK